MKEVYANNEQRFGVGDVVVYKNHTGMILEVIQEADESYWYKFECRNEFWTDTVPQDSLTEA